MKSLIKLWLVNLPQMTMNQYHMMTRVLLRHLKVCYNGKRNLNSHFKILTGGTENLYSIPCFRYCRVAWCRPWVYLLNTYPVFLSQILETVTFYHQHNLSNIRNLNCACISLSVWMRCRKGQRLSLHSLVHYEYWYLRNKSNKRFEEIKKNPRKNNDIINIHINKCNKRCKTDSFGYRNFN